MSESNPPSVNGSKIAIYPELAYAGKSGSNLLKIATALAVLFFITTVIFIIVFAVYYTKYDDEVSAEKAPLVEAKEDICNTPECVISAGTMARRMNLSANPCDDFSEYACGRFIKEMVLPDGKTRMGTFNVLSDENNLIMKTILTEIPKIDDPTYLGNMKRFYNSCIDEGQIDNIGIKPYIAESSFIDDWPLLNASWTETNFNLTDLITRYMKVYIEPIISFYVSTDSMNSTLKALYLNEPSLGLSQEYFRKPRNDSVIVAYEKYLVDFAVELGAPDTAVTRNDAKEVVDLEIALSKIMVPREERRESWKLYNPVNMSELSGMYPDLDIPGALRAAFGTVGIGLPDNERVINRFPTFIGNISIVLENTTAKAIQNLFGFKYALSKVGSLTRSLREIRLDFDKVYAGSQTERPRWEVCLEGTASAFWRGMAKKFVNSTFSEGAKKYMNEMIDNLKAVFKEMIDENTWMTQPTKVEAHKKLAAITRKIGYPDVEFSDSEISAKLENHTMNATDYYSNRQLINALSAIDSMLSLRKPVDRNEWGMAPYEVNAYYSWDLNEIVFPAGILQPPFFSQTFQDSMNYGAIGVVIGHEITHGFDDQGSQYDYGGNMIDWWVKEDKDRFKNRTQCIVDQNNGFHVADINMTVNGINTQGESVADNGGLKESFRAYKELTRKVGEKPKLPGLGLTQDQLFFLAYGQVWCEKMTPQRWINQIRNGVHPPGKYRILGPLQNSPDFAKAYNCPHDSYMNPHNKCSVW